MITKRVRTNTFRLFSTLILLTGAILLHAGMGPSLRAGLVLWFGTALGIGLVLARWWALLLALIPWPVGVGLALFTGRFAFLGDLWQLVALMSVLTGLGGTILGVAISQSWQN